MFSLICLILWTVASAASSLGSFEFYEDKMYRNVFYGSKDPKHISYFVDSTDLSEEAAQILKISESMSVYRNFVQQTVENLPAIEMMARILETDEISFEILGKNRKGTKYILRPTKHILMIRKGMVVNLGNFYSATFAEGNVLFKYTNGDRNFGKGTNSTNIQFSGALKPVYKKYYLEGIDLYGFTIELPGLTRTRYQVGLKTQMVADQGDGKSRPYSGEQDNGTDGHIGNSNIEDHKSSAIDNRAGENTTAYDDMASEYIGSISTDHASPENRL